MAQPCGGMPGGVGAWPLGVTGVNGEHKVCQDSRQTQAVGVWASRVPSQDKSLMRWGLGLGCGHAGLLVTVLPQALTLLEGGGWVRPGSPEFTRQSALDQGEPLHFSGARDALPDSSGG